MDTRRKEERRISMRRKYQMDQSIKNCSIQSRLDESSSFNYSSRISSHPLLTKDERIERSDRIKSKLINEQNLINESKLISESNQKSQTTCRSIYITDSYINTKLPTLVSSSLNFPSSSCKYNKNSTSIKRCIKKSFNLVSILGLTFFLTLVLCTIASPSDPWTRSGVRRRSLSESRKNQVEKCPQGVPEDIEPILDPASKGLLSPIVFIGKLISLSEDYAGRIATTFRVLKQIKNTGSSHGTVPVNLLPGTFVTLYFVNHPSNYDAIKTDTNYQSSTNHQSDNYGNNYLINSKPPAIAPSQVPPYCAVQLNRTQVDSLRPIGKYIVYASPPLTSLVRMHQQSSQQQQEQTSSLLTKQGSLLTQFNQRQGEKNLDNYGNHKLGTRIQGMAQEGMVTGMRSTSEAGGKNRPGDTSPLPPSFASSPSSSPSPSSHISTIMTTPPPVDPIEGTNNFFQKLFSHVSNHGAPATGRSHNRRSVDPLTTSTSHPTHDSNGHSNGDSIHGQTGSRGQTGGSRRREEESNSTASFSTEELEEDLGEPIDYMHTNYLSAFAPPDLFSKRATRSMKKTLCHKCGKDFF